MAVPTKTARTVIASQSIAALGSASGTLDLTTKFGGVLTVRVTNGGTGPTVGASVFVEVSTDGSTWRELSKVTHVNTANAIADWQWWIDWRMMHIRVRITGHTGQAVTGESLFHEGTSIG